MSEQTCVALIDAGGLIGAALIAACATIIAAKITQSGSHPSTRTTRLLKTISRVPNAVIAIAALVAVILAILAVGFSCAIAPSQGTAVPPLPSPTGSSRTVISTPVTLGDLSPANLFYRNNKFVEFRPDSLVLRGDVAHGVGLVPMLPANFRVTLGFEVLDAESDLYLGVSSVVDSVYPSRLLRVDNGIYSLIRFYTEQGVDHDEYLGSKNSDMLMDTTRIYTVTVERRANTINAFYDNGSGNTVIASVTEPIATLNHLYIASNAGENGATGIVIREFLLEPLP